MDDPYANLNDDDFDDDNRQSKRGGGQNGYDRNVRRQCTAEDVRGSKDYDEYDTADMEDEDRGRRSRRDLDEDYPIGKKKRRKKHHPVRNIIIILLILLLVVIGLFINVTRKFHHIDTEVSKNRGAMGQQVNILLIGQDAREGQEQQRSDSMILLTMNRSNHTVVLTSLMRDMYVDIPGGASNRINVAYARGGVDLLDETIEQDFGIKIDGNAMVDFEGFTEAMGGLGGLKINLSQEEADYMNANPSLGEDTDTQAAETWNLVAGENVLTSKQLLCYSRMRHVGNSDWDRTGRQRNVLQAAITKVKHGHLIGGYRMASNAAPYVTTDTTTGQMLRMAFSIMTAKDGLKSYLIPVEGTYTPTYIDGMAVLVPDMDKNKSYLQQYMTGEYKDTNDSDTSN